MRQGILVLRHMSHVTCDIVEIKAQLNYLRLSPRKVRLVASLIKGMDVKRAEVELRHLPKRASGTLFKLLRSAVSNAQNNFQLEKTGLFIKDIRVNQGPVFKRFRARAFGRAAPIRKKSSHVVLILDTKAEEVSIRMAGQKTEPVVREVTAEDLGEKEARDRGPKEEKRVSAQRPKTPGFVRRMFRRKAI